MANVYVKSRTINTSKRRIWGNLKLSDGSQTKFEMVKGETWYQWGNSTDSLGITVGEVERITSEWLERGY